MAGAVSVRELTAPSSDEVAALAELFESYRAHYGQARDVAGSARWLDRNLGSGSLHAFVAADGSGFVGFAVTAEIPASLRLAHFWQVRDLYVEPAHRRLGIARALLDLVRAAATASGALRLTLQTEEDNAAALALYLGSGYLPLSGYRSLVRPLD